MNRFSAIVIAIALASSAGGGSRLAPIGASQPRPGTRLADCDPTALAPPGDTEGACRAGALTVVAANRDHAAALRALILDLVSVAPITRIRIGNGSIGPLEPGVKMWVAFKVQVKNTSGRAAQLRDEQFNLRVGPTRYLPHPEATSSEPDSLTKANRKLTSGKTATGSIVFEVPVPDLEQLKTAPAALRFAGFGGDFGFNQFPGNVVGTIRLYK